MRASVVRAYPAGQALRTGRFLYWHKGIATAQVLDGEQLIISCSGKAGMVVLEPLSIFSAGMPVEPIAAPSRMAPDDVLRRAKRMLGKPYSLSTFNCEHFLTTAFGLPPQSPQLTLGILAALGFMLFRQVR